MSSRLQELLFSEGSYFPLFTEGEVPFRIYRGGSTNEDITLYTAGYYGVAESLDFFVGGVGLSCLSSLDLYCLNTGAEGFLNFYVVGEGQNDGYSIGSSYTDFFIKCSFGAELPFYCLGGPQPSHSNSFFLYGIGHSDVNASLDLVIPNVYGSLTSSINLYTSGF